MLPARRPYEDELACSAVLRCSRQFNVPIGRLGLIQLGRAGWHPSFLGASPLQKLAELFAMSPEELLWSHSPFPYATATMQPRYYERAISNVYGDAARMRGMGAVTQNVSLGLVFRRYCRLCAAEEFQRWRESYWHRSHNLPGVLLCLRHQTFLHASELPIFSHSHDRRLPHECKGRRLGTGEPSSALQDVARISAAWLQRSRGPGAHVEPAVYRQMAIDNGWLSASRPVNLQALTNALVTTFTSRFLGQAGMRIGSRGALWAGLMLRPGTTLPFVPAKHAVLQALFGQTRGQSTPPIDHLGGGPSASSARQLDDLYSREARKELKRVLANGLPLTTEQFLRGVGCWGVYKHRMAELPKLRAVVREFRGSVVTVKRLRPGKTLYRSDRAPTSDA